MIDKSNPLYKIYEIFCVEHNVDTRFEINWYMFLAGVNAQRRLNAQQTKPIDVHSGEWGHLPGEPCRYCHIPGGVYFLIDNGPEGIKGLQIQRCVNCHRSWT